MRPLLFLGIILFGVLVYWLGPGDIVGMVGQVGLSFAGIFLLHGVYQLLGGLALGRCALGGQGIAPSRLFWIRVSGETAQFLTFTGPASSMPMRAWLMKRAGLTTQQAFAASVSEYLLYTLTSAALAIAGLSILIRHFELQPALRIGSWVVLVAMVLFLSSSLVAIAGRIYLIGALVSAVGRLPWIGRRLGIDPGWIRGMEDQLLEILRERPGRLAAILALELLCQSLLIIELFWIFRALGLEPRLLDPLLIEATTKFITMAFFFIPTQVGAAEGVYALLFHALGYAAAVGFSIALVRRIRSLLIAGLGLAYGFWTGGQTRDGTRAP